MLSPFQVTALPCSMAKARGASSSTWAPFPWGQGFSPPLLVIFRRRYFMSQGQKQVMFMNNGNFLSVTETQIFRETSTTNMWRNYFSKLTKNYLLTELNKQNISFWSPCREILVSCFFQYLFSEAIAITRKKKNTFLLVLPPCSSTRWSMAQRGQYTIWSVTTTNVGGYLLIRNISHLTAMDTGVPLRKRELAPDTCSVSHGKHKWYLFHQNQKLMILLHTFWKQ